MPAGEQQHRSVNGSGPFDDAVGARPDLIERLSVWESIAEHLPARTFGANVRGAKTFILPVIPLDQIAVDFRIWPKAGEFRGPPGALERTGKHASEFQSVEPFSQPASLTFTAPGKWQVRKPGVLSAN